MNDKTIRNDCAFLIKIVASAVQTDTADIMTEAEYEEIFNSLDIPSFINEDGAKAAKHVERLAEYEDSYDKIGYKNADGTNTLYMFSSPVKYMDENGELKDADPNITETTDTLKQSGYSYKNEFGKLKTYFADSLSNDKGVKIELNNDSFEFGFSINEKKQNIFQKAVSVFEKPQNEAAVISENRVQKLKHLKVDNQNNVVSLPTIDGATQTLILKEKPENNKVTFWVKSNDLTSVVDTVGNNVVFSSDDTAYSVGIVEVKDSDSLLSTNNTLTVLSTENDNTLVEVTLDESVTDSLDTVYPVSVTLSASTTSRSINSSAPLDLDYTFFEDTTLYTDGSTEYESSDFLIVGQAGSSSKHGTVFMKYDTSMIFNVDPQFIYQVSLFLTEGSGNSIPMYINMARVTSGWLEDTIDSSMYYAYDTSYVGNNDIVMEESGTAYAYEIDITHLFTDHMLYEQGYGGGVPNYGFQFFTDTSATYGKHICSSEFWDMTCRPYISITYEDPSPYPGYTTHDYINPDDPSDWHSFTPTDTAVYDFYTTGNTDVYAFLYDSDLALITQDDNSGESLNFKISCELQANQIYYLKVQGKNSTTTGYYYLNIEHPDPFHHSNIDYVRIKKYDQTSWNGDSDITTIVTKSLKDQSAYFEVFAPDRSNISFLITQEVIDALNVNSDTYLNYPSTHLASMCFRNSKTFVDEFVEADIIDYQSPEYYGIWVLDFNYRIAHLQVAVEQISLISATITAAYNTYKVISGIKTAQMSYNSTQTLDYNTYKTLAEETNDLFNELTDDGHSFTKEDTMWITRKSDGKICWLETGNSNSGFQHIISGHLSDFSTFNLYSELDVSSFIYNVVTNISPTQITSSGQYIYSINGKNLSVIIGSNGYIVTAYPGV